MSLFPYTFSSVEEYQQLPWEAWSHIEKTYDKLKQQQIIVDIEFFYKKYPDLTGFKIEKKSKSDFKNSSEYRMYKRKGVSILNDQIEITLFDKNKISMNKKGKEDFICYLEKKGYQELYFIKNDFVNIARKDRYNVYRKIATNLNWNVFHHIIRFMELNMQGNMKVGVFAFDGMLIPAEIFLRKKEDVDWIFERFLIDDISERQFNIEILKASKFIWDIEKLFLTYPDLNQIELTDIWKNARNLSYMKNQSINIKIDVTNIEDLLKIEQVIEDTPPYIISKCLPKKKNIIKRNNRFKKYEIFIKENGILDLKMIKKME